MFRDKQRRKLSCPECSTTARFVVIAQQVSIGADDLSVLVEHVIVACGNCRNAFDVTRGACVRYKGEAGATPPENGKPDPNAGLTDTDLPLSFTGQR